jgi:hypothetical protein
LQKKKREVMVKIPGYVGRRRKREFDPFRLRKKCDLNFIQVPKTTQEEKMERVEG